MKSVRILQKVKQDYTAIAEEFNFTRDRQWPEFSVFLEYLKKTNAKMASDISPKVLDVGCGNGRLAAFLKNELIHYIGLDNNKKLLSIAKKNNPKATFRYGDILKLPFPIHSFDTIWCIAVLHHIPTKKLQLKALREMRRVLKKGGFLILMVWNLWQKKYKKYIDAKTHGALISWGKEKKVKRFYYTFRYKELADLLKRAEFSTLKKISSKYNLAYVCS